MAFTGPKMGLRIWNLLTDLYDHSQLADNWAKVEYHDHSPGKGVQVPTEGLADGAVTGPKLATALDPSGAYTAYRQVTSGNTSAAFLSATSYLLRATSYTVGGADSARAAFRIEPGDHSTPGRTPKMRLAATYITNAVAPANTLTAALVPVATWGGASGTAPTVATLGTAVVGSSVTFVSQAASTAAYTVSTDFDLPSAGWYVLNATVNTNGAVNSWQTLVAELQVHYV